MMNPVTWWIFSVMASVLFVYYVVEQGEGDE